MTVIGLAQPRSGSATTMPPRTPAYRRIADDIERKIRTGELAAGAKLPSIAELAAHYEAGQTTVKSALNWLAALGLTEGQQGKGVYVAEKEA